MASFKNYILTFYMELKYIISKEINNKFYTLNFVSWRPGNDSSFSPFFAKRKTYIISWQRCSCSLHNFCFLNKYCVFFWNLLSKLSSFGKIANVNVKPSYHNNEHKKWTGKTSTEKWKNQHGLEQRYPKVPEYGKFKWMTMRWRNTAASGCIFSCLPYNKTNN